MGATIPSKIVRKVIFDILIERSHVIDDACDELIKKDMEAMGSVSDYAGELRCTASGTRVLADDILEGIMSLEEAVEVLVNLYEDTDPKIREYVIRGLKNYKDNEVAEKIMLQATRDNHYKVRLEAIEAIKVNEIKSAVPYLIYRAKNDPENVVKKSAWPVIASLNTNEGNEFLVNQIKDKKIPDNTKSIVAKSLLEYNNAGSEEIIELAKETLKDDKRKPLRYALGKEFAKYKRDEYADLCVLYIANKDVATQGTGLDIYAKGRYASAESEIEKLILTAAKDTKKRNGFPISSYVIIRLCSYQSNLELILLEFLYHQNH